MKNREPRFEIYPDTEGGVRFLLRDERGNVVVVTPEGFDTFQAAENEIRRLLELVRTAIKGKWRVVDTPQDRRIA